MIGATLKHSVYILLVVSVLILPACIQQRTIQKAYAFSQHVTFGTIATDEKGNTITPGSQTQSFIFLEMPDNATPVINEVSVNSASYKNIALTDAGGEPVLIGIDKSSNQKITLTTAKGNRLWRIDLPAEDKRNVFQDDAAEITVWGRMNGTPFTIAVTKKYELKPFEGL